MTDGQLTDKILEALQPVPPRDWTGRDNFNDPMGYDDPETGETIVGEPDLFNAGDNQEFGADRERHRIYWMIWDKFLDEGDPTP